MSCSSELSAFICCPKLECRSLTALPLVLVHLGHCMKEILEREDHLSEDHQFPGDLPFQLSVSLPLSRARVQLPGV